MDPMIKWLGGKRWLVDKFKFITEFTNYSRIVEPFCGGAAISFGLNCESALINDENIHLIGLYKYIQEATSGKRVISFSCSEETYYENRELFNKNILSGNTNSPQHAQLFYYLSKNAFNGLIRFNSKGLFNAASGKYSKVSYFQEWPIYSKLIKNWTICSGDFENITPILEDGDLIYADPPYDDTFDKYSKCGFSWNDQIRLCEWLVKCNRPSIVSNNGTKRIIDMYTDAGFTVATVFAPRRISCDGDRTKAMEILASRGTI